MREIKFRGIKKENGNWVHGYGLLQGIDPHKKENEICKAFIHTGVLNQYEVKLETVGQYTGLKDKNGTEIYEGDVLINTHHKSTRLILWGSDGWLARTVYDSWLEKNVINENRDSFLKSYSLHPIEVIGNIHQNPELI